MDKRADESGANEPRLLHGREGGWRRLRWPSVWCTEVTLLEVNRAAWRKAECNGGVGCDRDAEADGAKKQEGD